MIRGEDHLSNTPKHILLFRALGHAVPRFAHLPLILNPDRTKMSKRKSQTAVSDYIAEGFIREALVNYLALLGWSTGTEEEIFTIDEIVERFDLSSASTRAAPSSIASGSNGSTASGSGGSSRTTSSSGCGRSSRPSWPPAGSTGCPATTISASCCRWSRERLPTLGAIGDLVGFLWVRDLEVDPATLVPKRWDAATTNVALVAAREVIADTGDVSFEADELEPPLRALAEARGWKAGDLFMAIRVAVTGRTATPPLFDTLVALGRERTLERLARAVAVLEEGSVPR